jgi:hypothetical protein
MEDLLIFEIEQRPFETLTAPKRLVPTAQTGVEKFQAQTFTSSLSA